MNTIAHQVPDGFQAFDHAGHFANFMGPYFFREMPAGDFRYAFWTYAIQGLHFGVHSELSALRLVLRKLSRM